MPDLDVTKSSQKSSALERHIMAVVYGQQYYKSYDRPFESQTVFMMILTCVCFILAKRHFKFIMSNQHRFSCSEIFYRNFHKWKNGPLEILSPTPGISVAGDIIFRLLDIWGNFHISLISDIFWRPFSWLHEHYHRVTSALLEQGAKINDFTFGSPFYGFCYI